jgi:hypothetical protein
MAAPHQHCASSTPAPGKAAVLSSGPAPITTALTAAAASEVILTNMTPMNLRLSLMKLSLASLGYRIDLKAAATQRGQQHQHICHQIKYTTSACMQPIPDVLIAADKQVAARGVAAGHTSAAGASPPTSAAAPLHCKTACAQP